ncbi:MAG TPA: CvpA family protein [Aliiroseovarius sp.]|nr:CvpA family protein [Aliiroseovarius sp.]
MEAFTIFDGAVALVILVSAILAYSRGFVREGMAIAGWIAAAIVAYIAAPKARPMVQELPVVGDFLDNCELATIASFVGVFAVALLVVSLFTPLFSTAIQRSALGSIDQALGFVFGALRGVLLVAIALVVYDRLVATDTIPMIDDSRTAKIFARTQAKIDESIPEDAPGWLIARYTALVSDCQAPV